jgi:hypothetical protein
VRPLQLLDALAEIGAGPDRDLQLAALRVCAKAGAVRAAQRVWERLQGRGASPQVPLLTRHRALLVSAASSCMEGCPEPLDVM